MTPIEKLGLVLCDLIDAHGLAWSGELRDAWDESMESHLSDAKTSERYHELLLAVGNKCEGETRHQTALRYILQAERPCQTCVALASAVMLDQTGNA